MLAPVHGGATEDIERGIAVYSFPAVEPGDVLRAFEIGASADDRRSYAKAT